MIRCGAKVGRGKKIGIACSLYALAFKIGGIGTSYGWKKDEPSTKLMEIQVNLVAIIYGWLVQIGEESIFNKAKNWENEAGYED